MGLFAGVYPIDMHLIGMYLIGMSSACMSLTGIYFLQTCTFYRRASLTGMDLEMARLNKSNWSMEKTFETASTTCSVCQNARTIYHSIIPPKKL